MTIPLKEPQSSDILSLGKSVPGHNPSSVSRDQLKDLLHSKISEIRSKCLKVNLSNVNSAKKQMEEIFSSFLSNESPPKGKTAKPPDKLNKVVTVRGSNTNIKR
ncbi:hypothetical protein J6590_103136 [Homalodisca vitripennis]|nr:hypothetical protein J6590_103136 [Homalodisca vitripennis]